MRIITLNLFCFYLGSHSTYNTFAQSNTDGGSTTDIPDWQPVGTEYGTNPPFTICTTDSDCDGDQYVCVQHMWEYNGQTDSGTGCWDQTVCTNTQSWYMLDNRRIQWFCSLEQRDKGNEYIEDGGSLAYPLTSADIYWYDYEDSCSQDSDCSEDQYCTTLLWEATEDRNSYSFGSACYNWDTPVCPSVTSFAMENMNYEENGYFSYYNEYWCTDSFVSTVPMSSSPIVTNGPTIYMPSTPSVTNEPTIYMPSTPSVTNEPTGFMPSAPKPYPDGKPKKGKRTRHPNSDPTPTPPAPKPDPDC